jgi:hypothetical protein
MLIDLLGVFGSISLEWRYECALRRVIWVFFNL